MKKLFTLFIVLFYSHFIYAQWSPLGLSDIQCRCLATDGIGLFVGTDHGGIFRSVDNGLTWDTINNGLTELVVRDIEINGSNIYAGTWNGMFLTDDHGASWKPINNGLTHLDIRAIETLDSIIYIGTNGGGVFKSSDNGNNWTAINNGLSQKGVLALAVDSFRIYAGTYSGIFTSSDGGNSWNSLNGINIQTSSIDISDSIIIAGTVDGCYKSDNLGETWVKSSSGITEDYVTAVIIKEKDMYAGTWGGSVFLSIDNADSWNSYNVDLSGNYISDFIIHNGNLIASTLYEGVWVYEKAVNINEIPNDLHINIFPNPATDIFTINPEPKSVEIFNSIGQLEQKYDSKNKIDVTQFAKGLYFVRVETDNGSVHLKKLIVK